MNVNNSFFNEKKRVLKNAGMWWKPNILLSGKTVFFIGFIATVVDGITIYMTLDPILKGMFIFTLLLSCICAAVLDLFPVYWPIAIGRLREKVDSSNGVKVFFVISVVAWCIVMLSLCLFRFASWDFILLEALQENSIALAENEGLYQPELTKVIGMLIMLFLSAVNIATSAGVLLASFLATKSPKEEKESKKLTIKTRIDSLINEKQQEIDQLNDVITFDYTRLDAERLRNMKDIADNEAAKNKVIAREVLEEELSDSDVDYFITNSYHNVAEDDNNGDVVYE